MRKYFLLVMACGLFQISDAQKNDEDFLNEVVSLIYPKVDTITLLLESKDGFHMEFSNLGIDSEIEKYLRPYFKSLIPDSSWNAIKANAFQNIRSYKWDFNRLGSGWIEGKYPVDDPNQVITERNGTIYHFCRPIFDSSKAFCLLKVMEWCGSLCGSGDYFLFKRENNSWKLLRRVNLWVS